MMEPIKNTYSPPEWLNEEFLQNALREGLKRKDLQITECAIETATNAGDNYLSRMFRAKTVITNEDDGREELNIIIKSMPKGEYAEGYVNEMKFFEKEATMLNETLRTMGKILADVGLPKLFADVYYVQGKPDSLLVLEDLSRDGFRMANRHEGLDLPHCVLVLEGLATFHASSLVAVDRNPELKERHKDVYWTNMKTKEFLEVMDKNFDLICSWSDLPKELITKLRKYQPDALNKMIEASARNDDELNVITHGDPWTNNFMFKYSGDSPVAIKLVDFQLSGFCHPVNDIMYFLMSSPRHDIKLEYIDFFLRTYHNKLLQVCEKLNYKLTFTLGDLREGFMQRLAFGLFTAMVVYPVASAPPSAGKELNDLFEETMENPGPSQHFLRPKYQKGLKTLLNYFLENGLFD